MNAPELLHQDIAAAINAEHELACSCAHQAVEHARVCGEKLIEAKGEVGHGNWGAWLKANCRVSERQAQRYMKLAQGWDRIAEKSDTVSDLTLSGALKLLAEPRSDDESAAVLPPPIGSDFDALWEWAGRQIDAPLNQFDLECPDLIPSKMHRQLALPVRAAFCLEECEGKHPMLRAADDDDLCVALRAYADVLNGKRSLKFCAALSTYSLGWLCTRTELVAKRGIGKIMLELDARRKRYRKDDGSRLCADGLKVLDDFVADCDARMAALGVSA